MRDDISYELYVKQPVEMSLQQMTDASKQFGVTDDEVNRAILNWVVERVQNGPVPNWLFTDMKKLQDTAPVEPGGDEDE